MRDPGTYSAFAGDRRIARGTLEEILRKTKQRLQRKPDLQVLIFEDRTGRQVEFDFRRSVEEIVRRAQPEVSEQAPGPGRPRLGVVSREVSLLPRHWEWLEAHPQGISAGIRRLVDEARKRDPEGDRARSARFAASRFMSAMAGDLPKFEEASRALFAENKIGFAKLIQFWPADVRQHLDELLAEGGAFDEKSDPEGSPRRKRT
jgi:hypothetical protein